MSPDKSPTLKITLPNGVSLIKFKASKEELENLKPENNCGGTTINIVGTCKINEWNGRITPQIEIRDYEVVSKTNYLF